MPGGARALKQCRQIAAGRAWCAFLVGGYGVGKTHLAIATLNALLKERGGYFWKMPDFLDWLRQRAFRDGIPLDEILNSYRYGAGLIVFDDYGAENRTDWASEQMYRILDSRSDARLPTILTTNVEIDALDGRILSRFREGLIICEGTDQREKAKA